MNAQIFNRTNRFSPRILLIQPEYAPSATIYIIKPLRELARQKKIIFERSLESKVTLGQIISSDLVLFSRNREPAHNWILEECLSRSIPTIYDLDDNFWEVPVDLPYANHYRAPERLHQLEYYLWSVDLIRVYSPLLFDRVKDFNQNVSLVNPCIDINLVPIEPLPRKSDKIRITYVTGRGSSDALLTMFSNDLLKLFDIYPNLIEMYWWGEIPKVFNGLIPDKLVPIIHDYDEFLIYLSREAFDIGLAPLTSSVFNLSKTNTKFRDYGASRIAGVYSNVAVYSSCVQHEHTGLLVGNQPGAWFEAMARLVENRELRIKIQETAYQYVYDHYRQEFVEKQWEQSINSILKIDQQIFPSQKPPLQPTRSQLVKLSLGRQEAPLGFISVNRHTHPGVSVIADINHPLPFATNTTDLLIAEHSLEYVDDLEIVMQEIYRVSKHRAQICILAPYSQPHFESKGYPHNHHFNERTIKSWTTAVSPVEKKVHFTMDTHENTTFEISNQQPDIDLRCLQMEFFYTPEFLNLQNDEKSVLRQERPQVCDMVLYHFVAIKQTIKDEEVEQIALEMECFEPISISIRRLEDTNETLKVELDLLLRTLKIGESDLHLVQNNLAAKQAELEQAQATKTVELEQTQTMLADKTTELQTLHTEFALLLHEARRISRDLEVFQNRKIFKLIERIFDRTDNSQSLPPDFQQLKDDSFLFNRELHGYILQPSINLQQVPFLPYYIEFNRPNLREILLAPLLDVPAGEGTLGVELVSPQNQIIAQTVLPATQINSWVPARFDFPPITQSTQGRFKLRIFARDLDVPLRVYEWRKYPPIGLGRIKRIAFCGFGFTEG